MALGFHVRERHGALRCCRWDDCGHRFDLGEGGIVLGVVVELHMYEKHGVRLHRHADLEWCCICQEWYYDLDSQGNFAFWIAHCQAHYDRLFSRFSERVSGPVDNMGEIHLIDGKFVEFEHGQGFGGSRPEFHGHVVKHITLSPFFCPFCVYDDSLDYSKRTHQ
jgi:hypothetical protein